MRILRRSQLSAGRLPALLVALALQSCAVVSAGPAPARSPSETAAPAVTPSLATRPPPVQPPETASASPGPAPEADDPEIAARVDEDSTALQQVHDAEVSAEAAAPPTAGAASIPTLPELPELQADLATLQAKYDIPIVVNEAVVRCIRLFQSPEVRPHFVRWL